MLCRHCLKATAYASNTSSMLRRAKHPEVHGVSLYTADNTGAHEPTGQDIFCTKFQGHIGSSSSHLPIHLPVSCCNSGHLLLHHTV
ncbi:hypothetical protein JZ751_021647 [Albula glossodonta]|uniref:Uncharacterized protein n=1 Tax=Albula glossodonta TaxID=121402 RepID=A0A8T2NV14_9TELE|nr:hypothetical protein JZ751_021647 [Albula glossodonta]